MKTQLSIDIDHPLGEVFQRTVHDVTKWSITCVEHEMLKGTAEGVGSKFRLVTDDNGRRMEFKGTVTEHAASSRSRIYLENKSMDLDVLYTFHETMTGTRVTQMSHARGNGLFRIILPVMGLMMKKSACDAQRRELDALKAFCDSVIEPE